MVKRNSYLLSAFFIYLSEISQLFKCKYNVLVMSNMIIGPNEQILFVELSIQKLILKLRINLNTICKDSFLLYLVKQTKNPH